MHLQTLKENAQRHYIWLQLTFWGRVKLKLLTRLRTKSDFPNLNVSPEAAVCLVGRKTLHSTMLTLSNYEEMAKSLKRERALPSKVKWYLRAIPCPLNEAEKCGVVLKARAVQYQSKLLGIIFHRPRQWDVAVLRHDNVPDHGRATDNSIKLVKAMSVL